MNPRIIRTDEEIRRLRGKIADYQVRLKDLERQKTELENADIVAMVRGIDIPPGDIEAFIRKFKEQQGCAVPNLSADMLHDEEDKLLEK